MTNVTRWTNGILFIIILVLSCWGITIARQIDEYKNSFSEAAEHIISHRGASGEEREHSFDAYDLAIAYGAKYIEQDLAFSGEGSLYVSHDIGPSIWIDGERSVSDCLDSELDTYGIVKLQDVFDRYSNSDVVFVVEVRQAERDRFDGVSQVEALIDLLKNNDLSGRIIVQAWDLESLEVIKNYDERIPTMLLIGERENLSLWSNDCVDIVCTSYELMDVDIIESVHSAGKKYCVYTVNSCEDIETVIRNNVDMYFTNYVAKAFVLEKEFRQADLTNDMFHTDESISCFYLIIILLVICIGLYVVILIRMNNTKLGR